MYFDLTEMVIHLCILTAKNIDLSYHSCVYFDLTEIVICMCILTLQKKKFIFLKVCHFKRDVYLYVDTIRKTKIN